MIIVLVSFALRKSLMPTGLQLILAHAAETNLDRIERDPSVGNPFAVHAQLGYCISQVEDKIDSESTFADEWADTD